MTTKKTAGRRPLKSPPKKVGPQLIGTTLPAEAKQELIERSAVEGYGEERDLLNQMLGQHQALMAVSQFSLTFGISKLAYIKEHKIYRGLRGMAAPSDDGKNSRRQEKLTGTWEEFCEVVVGRSVAQVDEDIQNLRSFGDQALESMSRAGVGYRDLRKLRLLPDDSKTALIEVAKKGDKEALLELAEDLIAKGETEKKKLADERDKAINQYDAREQVIASNKKQIAQLEEKLARIPREKSDEKAKAMVLEIGGTTLSAAAELRQLIKGAQMLLEYSVENDLPTEQFKATIDSQLAGLFSEIADLLSLLELSGMPAHLNKLRLVLGVVAE